MIDRFPEDTQTIHAELLATLLAQEGERSWSHLSGSFATKSIKGAVYVYFQYSDPGGAKRQFAVGRRDASLDAIVASYGEQREQREAVYQFCLDRPWNAERPPANSGGR